jgi:hypothetical protein
LVLGFPLCKCGIDNSKQFIQFYLFVNIEGVFQHMIGWAHPDLILLTQYGDNNLFVDCTYKVVPKGFIPLSISNV